MKNDKCVLGIFCASFVILIFLLLIVSSYWEQVIAYLLGANTLILGQLTEQYFARIREENKEKLFIKNLLESICQEIKLFKEDYFDPINTKLDEIDDNKPMFEKFSASHASFSIYFFSIKHIGIIKNNIRKDIISCYYKLRELVDVIIKHDDEYDALISICIKEKVSTDSLENYDPSSTTSYQETNKKHKELLRSTKSVKNAIEKTKPVIEEVINKINDFVSSPQNH